MQDQTRMKCPVLIINCAGVDTHIHIGALYSGKVWYWLWPRTNLDVTAWKNGAAPSGTRSEKCAYMNVNTGLWAPQDCKAGTAFVCEKKIGEDFQYVVNSQIIKK